MYIYHLKIFIWTHQKSTSIFLCLCCIIYLRILFRYNDMNFKGCRSATFLFQRYFLIRVYHIYTRMKIYLRYVQKDLNLDSSYSLTQTKEG